MGKRGSPNQVNMDQGGRSRRHDWKKKIAFSNAKVGAKNYEMGTDLSLGRGGLEKGGEESNHAKESHTHGRVIF